MTERGLVWSHQKVLSRRLAAGHHSSDGERVGVLERKVREEELDLYA